MEDTILKSTIKFGLATLVLATAASTVNAAVITLNEVGMDAVYGQVAIDIRYNASQTIFNSALLSIDSNEEFDSLSTYEVGGNTISMFFVDQINFCGVALANIVGCGSTPGTLTALDSGFIASSDQGVTTMAHEVGHNLGLGHLNDGTNLMNPVTFTFNPSSLPGLTLGQIATILASSLVQTDGGGQKFISITPFLVATDQVPEPSTLSLIGLALGVAAWKRRTRSV